MALIPKLSVYFNSALSDQRGLADAPGLAQFISPMKLILAPFPYCTISYSSQAVKNKATIITYNIFFIQLQINLYNQTRSHFQAN